MPFTSFTRLQPEVSFRPASIRDSDRAVDINSATTAVSTHVEAGPSVSRANELSAPERIFCEVFVGNGGKAGEAARAAGYADASADVTACKLLCRPRVASRIKHLVETFAHSTLPVAVQTLVEIAGDKEALRKDRIKAANSLVELAGMTAPKGGINVNVGVAVNGQQAQTLIKSVWDARSHRMSDIPTPMPDTIDAIGRAIDELDDDTSDDGRGGDQPQGPGPGRVDLPPPSDAQQPQSDVPGSDALARWHQATKGDDDV